MNSKILIAFITGAVIASGIVYMAVRPAPASTARPAPPPPPAESPAPPVAVTATPAAAPALPSRAPAREKPSPMPPPLHREKPVTIAQNREPRQPAPEPAPEPVNKQPDPPPQAQSVPQQPAPDPAPAPAQVAAPPENVPPPQPAPEVRVPHRVTIAAGTVLPVRIGETISASHNQSGDSFLATLDQPLVVDGFVIAERGSRLEGRVVEAEPAGRSRGNSHLGIELVKLSTSDGQHVQIHTVAYKKEGTSSAGNDAAKIAGGAALGAAIGGIAGGGKGAAIGVGAGAAAGVAGVMLTRGKPAEIPVETRISFRIADPVTITERLN